MVDYGVVCYHPGMNRETLLVKRESIKDAFDKQVQLEAEAKSEQLRLQGENRLINELIEGMEEN